MVCLGFTFMAMSYAMGLEPVAQVQQEAVAAPKIETLRVIHGSGAIAKVGDVVKVHVVASAGDRVVMDTSKTGLPFTFLMGDEGQPAFLTLAVAGLKPKGSRECSVPWQLAGGTEGRPPALPPKMNLKVTVKLLEIVRPGVNSGS